MDQYIERQPQPDYIKPRGFDVIMAHAADPFTLSEPTPEELQVLEPIARQVIERSRNIQSFGHYFLEDNVRTTEIGLVTGLLQILRENPTEEITEGYLESIVDKPEYRLRALRGHIRKAYQISMKETSGLIDYKFFGLNRDEVSMKDGFAFDFQGPKECEVVTELLTRLENGLNDSLYKKVGDSYRPTFPEWLMEEEEMKGVKPQKLIDIISPYMYDAFFTVKFINYMYPSGEAREEILQALGLEKNLLPFDRSKLEKAKFDGNDDGVNRIKVAIMSIFNKFVQLDGKRPIPTSVYWEEVDALAKLRELLPQ